MEKSRTVVFKDPGVPGEKQEAVVALTVPKPIVRTVVRTGEERKRLRDRYVREMASDRVGEDALAWMEEEKSHNGPENPRWKDLMQDAYKEGWALTVPDLIVLQENGGFRIHNPHAILPFLNVETHEMY